MRSLKFKAVALFLSVLTVLSLLQCITDYRYEAEMERLTSAGVKEPVYCIFIEIQDKTLYLLENGKCIKEYTIASGMSGLPSPLGSWKVVEKGDWGEGFGGSWLGLDVPWGTYLIGLNHWILEFVMYFNSIIFKDFDFVKQFHQSCSIYALKVYKSFNNR